MVLSKPQLDHELTADPEGDRICCVILYVLYKKLSWTLKSVSQKEKEKKRKKMKIKVCYLGRPGEGGGPQQAAAAGRNLCDKYIYIVNAMCLLLLIPMIIICVTMLILFLFLVAEHWNVACIPSRL